MVAYSFKRRFVVPISVGIKPHTVRAKRKRHARPGEKVQLYWGMRTKSCRLIGKADCVDVHDIVLMLGPKGDEHIGFTTTPVYVPTVVSSHALDDFAIADGFEGWDNLCAFWREEHPGQHAFRGVLIRWDPATLVLSDWGKRHRDLGLEAARTGQKLTEELVAQMIQP